MKWYMEAYKGFPNWLQESVLLSEEHRGESALTPGLESAYSPEHLKKQLNGLILKSSRVHFSNSL